MNNSTSVIFKFLWATSKQPPAIIVYLCAKVLEWYRVLSIVVERMKRENCLNSIQLMGSEPSAGDSHQQKVLLLPVNNYK